MRRLIAVIGGEEPPAEVVPLAEEVGRRIAEAGAVLVCGGLGGVMAAACRGAHGAGGLTVGILPRRSRADANADVDIPIVTGLGVARNVLVALTGDAVIAVDGSYGTLTEIAHTLEARRPVVALRSWDLSSAGIDPARYVVVRTPAEAVARALEVAARASDPPDLFGGAGARGA